MMIHMYRLNKLYNMYNLHHDGCFHKRLNSLKIEKNKILTNINIIMTYIPLCFLFFSRDFKKAKKTNIKTNEIKENDKPSVDIKNNT